MKLRNKKTGEVGILIVDGAYNFVTNLAVENDERDRLGEYDSLAELNAEWEDMPEESKVIIKVEKNMGLTYLRIKCLTEEEAEKAAEKLKAWERLKDHNLKLKPGRRIFNNTDKVFTTQAVFLESDTYEYVEQDLDLLFGGEE